MTVDTYLTEKYALVPCIRTRENVATKDLLYDSMRPLSLTIRLRVVHSAMQ